jgi:hypothetical protein
MSLELTDLIGPGVAVVAVAVGVWQYRLTSLREFIKPVREAQLKLYQEASSAAAQIATLQQESPEWIKARQEFLRLYYGPLAIVESFDHATESGERLTVERAMIIFKSCLDDEKQCNELGANLSGLSLALAHSCRESLGRSWGYKVKQLEGDYQGAPAAILNKPKENRIGAFTTIACLRGLCYLLDVTSFDARMS